MANFKVGQRVRIAWVGKTAMLSAPSVIGREGTIVAIPSEHPGADCDVEIDGAPAVMFGYADRPWAAVFKQLTPLSDPGAAAFIERIKSMKPYEEPVREREPDYAAMLREFVRKA